KTPKAVVTWGNTIPAYVLSNTKFKAIIQIGTINNWNGIIIVARINIKITFLPLKFILASGYAASEQNNTLKTTVNIVTTTLLNKYLQKGKVSITLTKFIKVRSEEHTSELQ